ncbi:PIN-like domain-containing protein [Streptosporangium canum]|uniref:PIN-like domain-containing protein n=1 Tax=Streptosporangium canum TaxID=324952 RepID=UPI003434A5AF
MLEDHRMARGTVRDMLGIFDGFEAHRTPKDEDYESVLRSGLIVLDTNVLVDLYRMNSRTREDMLMVLDRIKDRLWIPNQVMGEFWGVRQGEDITRFHEKKAREARAAIEAALTKARGGIENWANNVHLSEASELLLSIQSSLDKVESIFGSIKNLLDRQADKDKVIGILDTNADPVIAGLSEMLHGRVGSAFDTQRRNELVATAKERADQKIPPGYKDFDNAKKDDNEAAGDYLVWCQILDEVEKQKRDVLLVTRDLKEDWWRQTPPGAMRLPRMELVDELRDLTGHTLFMLEPSSLMRRASTLFKLGGRVDINSVAALERLEIVDDGDDKNSDIDSNQYRLAQLPGGRKADYFQTIWKMTKIAASGLTVQECIQDFMEEFPNVTLAPEARRRLMNVVNLGLAKVREGRFTLTGPGRNYIETQDQEIIRELFMERIEGASKAREMFLDGVPISELKDQLAEHPELNLNPTQSELICRWMGKLGLLR